eukprot:jgi/Chlat1/1465/Chrsp12S02012
MYSNTPSDFDFKLRGMAEKFASPAEFLARLKQTANIVFPILHGRYGEDGGIQSLLEQAALPFIGTPAAAAAQAFDKYTAAVATTELGFAALPICLIESTVDEQPLAEWFVDNSISHDNGLVVVKPARAGSSVGVKVARGMKDAIAHAHWILQEEIDTRVVVEQYAHGGREFTAIVLQSRVQVNGADESKPVTLIPTEVELLAVDGGSDEVSIFNYRKKYLPTQQVRYHTPPRFSAEETAAIRQCASRLFAALGLRDVARMDGWLLPSTTHRIGGDIGRTASGTIVLTDINLVSGLEQTSFFFQQAAEVGLSHSSVLRYLLEGSCARAGIRLPPSMARPQSSATSRNKSKRPVFVIFGGRTSERQVSLISGTNVWLKLLESDKYEPRPFLLAPGGGSDLLQQTVWALPYASVLRHTVEEVVEGCERLLAEEETATQTAALRAGIRQELGLPINPAFTAPPHRMQLAEFMHEAHAANAIVFIAVHGGEGEDGSLQAVLEEFGVRYTGSGPESSQICMNKAATATALSGLADKGVTTAAKQLLSRGELQELCEASTSGRDASADLLWERLTKQLGASSLCIKPASDGCSTGVARLSSAADLLVYARAVAGGAPRLLPGALSQRHAIIEMPQPPPAVLLLEPFIITDSITIGKDGQLLWRGESRWVEVTCGMLGMERAMRALTLSITVRESGDVLSLEEKFQGGTGVNLTPPPPEIISTEALRRAQARLQLAAHTLGLRGFARIDAFVHADTGEVMVIEANTVPGMTPSTVLFHQALAENPPIYPKSFFNAICDLASFSQLDVYHP